MCGIVAVLYQRTPRSQGDAHRLVEATRSAHRRIAELIEQTPTAEAIERVANILADVDAALRGRSGLRCLLRNPVEAKSLNELSDMIGHDVRELESTVERLSFSTEELERVNAAIVAVKDAWWAIGTDRLGFCAAVRDLAGDEPSSAALDAYAAIQIGLSSLDRLELRGRDSSGLHVLVSGHGLDLNDPRIAAQVSERCRDPLFTSNAVRMPSGHLSFVYKFAAEIGKLGDNGRALRHAITNDGLLAEALQAPTSHAVVIGHTRWASVGMINQANAHPLNNEEASVAADFSDTYVAGVLNGDVDNYADLIRRHDLHITPEITTDAKVIPVLVGRRLRDGVDPADALRRAAREFDGSIATAVNCAADPTRVVLAQRGSGQSLLVGAAGDFTIVASELYGLVEHCREYVRMDSGSGHVIAIDSSTAGDLRALHRWHYDGSAEPITDADINTASITTRDIDRRHHQHFLEKELHEAPDSMRKTLRGRVAKVDGVFRVALDEDVVSPRLLARFQDDALRRIFVIGQGTAAVAGQAVADAVADALSPVRVDVTATTATELSGFHLAPDMSDTLVIAISQSGTTTDTNRAVDLLRQRGAIVIAIVNRRGSDLVAKADGVLYTSDGRDVEMSVASTKAFYAQVAAGVLLACALARAAGCADPTAEHELLSALSELPEAMQRLLSDEQEISSLATQFAPLRSSWAVVGSARNRIAAEEIRVKCSELTYRSISCDESSDKKHIDLSAEPMTLVCAAGVTGSAADDIAKEVEIFASHNGVPIVIASEGANRFSAAAGVIRVPKVHADLSFLMSAMAGHLFGYHAALAIDEQALPLRRARVAVEQAAEMTGRDPIAMLDLLTTTVAPASEDFMQRLRAGRYDGSLSASASARIALALRDITIRTEQGVLPQTAGPEAAINELTAALTEGIDQVSRTVDTIRHQAKTVTVGTSRSDEAILTVPLVRALLENGAKREALPYDVLRTVAALDPTVAEVVGATHYEINDDYIAVTSRAGIAANLTSRTDSDHRLLGTKLLVAEQQQPLVAIGSRDRRPVIIVPEITSYQTTGLLLLHAKFHQQVPAQTMKAVLNGYRDRLSWLRSAVTETQPTFDEQLLGQLVPLALLTEPPDSLAENWHRPD